MVDWQQATVSYHGFQEAATEAVDEGVPQVVDRPTLANLVLQLDMGGKQGVNTTYMGSTYGWYPAVF